MSCEGNVCGTGGWTGPLPGDPDNNVNLSATPAFGGIDINITYPVVNPYAVAYVILYRSEVNLFAAAVERTKFTGEYFFDRVDSNKVYYYWVQLVSINGTVLDLIGPASAQARPTIDQMIVLLTGQIDAGLLAQTLKTQIARIPALDLQVAKEVQDRLDSNAILSAALAQVQGNLDTALTYVNQEITERRDGDSALVDSISQLAAGVSGNAAALVTEQQVRAGKDSAMASDIEAMKAVVGDNNAGLIHDIGVATDTANAAAHDLLGLEAVMGNASSGIIHDLNVVTTTANGAASTASTAAQDILKLSSEIGDANSGIVQKLNTTTNLAQTAADHYTQLSSTVGDANSGLVHDMNTVATRVGSMAQDVTTVQSTLNGDVASGQVGLVTSVGNMSNTITGLGTTMGQIGSLYTVKLNVNGLIGGFGAYNDGNTVQMGFDVDSFWVGRTNASMKKPFIISGGETFIDEAVIATLTFDKLRAADGSLIVANGKVRADYLDVGAVTAKSIDISTGGAGSPSTHMINGLFQVYYPNGGLCTRMGIW